MSDPILPLLAIDMGALVLLGGCAWFVPSVACGFMVCLLGGLGLLVCLLALVVKAPALALTIPFGPPGLPLHLAIDRLSLFFLVMVFLAGTAVAAFRTTSVPATDAGRVATTAFGLAGTGLALLAADGVVLGIGLALACGAIGLRHGRGTGLLVPFLLLAAVCLLTPGGFAPSFDSIRGAPVDPNRAGGAAMLTLVGVGGLAWHGSGERGRSRDSLAAGVLMPAELYLLLRLTAELPGTATPAWCGFVLVLAGSAVAVVQGWLAASDADIDGSVACLVGQQAGLGIAGIGLALIARGADLPAAASLALAATFLTAMGGGVAGVLASLAVRAIGVSAGTWRLSRLGGLVQLMPATSLALAAGLLGLSALPCGLGFGCLWLLFEAILSAPHTGGLLPQLPLALMAAALALSAALATAGSVRLIGIALLGRPRTPRGAGAHEAAPAPRMVLLVMAGLSVVAGLLPGSALWLLADPAIRVLTGAPGGSLALPAIGPALPGYSAIAVFALLVLATGAVVLLTRRPDNNVRTAGFWADGMAAPAGLPFGDPAAQSVGEGFLPALPNPALPVMPRLPRFVEPRLVSAATGLWLVLAAFGALLAVLAAVG